MCSLEFDLKDDLLYFLLGELLFKLLLKLESLISSASHFSQVLNLPPGDLPLPSEKAD
jgi:hypothetical protein